MERDYDTPEGKEGADDDAYMMPMEQRDPMMWKMWFRVTGFLTEKYPQFLYDANGAEGSYDVKYENVIHRHRIFWLKNIVGRRRPNIRNFYIIPMKHI